MPFRQATIMTRGRTEDSINRVRTLLPSEAEEIVAERIEDFGTAALPEVRVSELPDGRWSIQWEDNQAVTDPMPMEAWKGWLEMNVGSVDPERVMQN